MDDKNKLIKKYENIKDNLPNEIFMNILYNYFEDHSYLIDIEIDKYLNIKLNFKY
jgi:hypothetical protein